MAEPVTSATPGSSPLQKIVEAYLQDEAWLLSHFTFVADVTTLASQCDVAHSPGMSVASCRALPHHLLSFLGDSPDLLRNYVGFLLQPGTQAYFLVNETQRAIVESALSVLEVIPEWQMVFRGDPRTLTLPHPVTPLEACHLAAMRELGQICGLLMMERDPLERGPAVGIFEGETLVAMATTRLQIPGAAEIGNVATHPAYRGRGYGRSVLGALLQSLWDPRRLIFALVHQENADAVGLAEALGFEKVRPMYLMRCSIPESCLVEAHTSDSSSGEKSSSNV